MRIALRPSGGRGDYELAGSDNGVHASELLEKQFYYQITPSLIINGKAKAHRLSGKPRIRPEGNGEHPYVVIYSILLLPQPRRELIKTTDSALMTLTRGEYILYGIDVDLVDTDADTAIFAPTNIWARNQASILKVDFAERMAVISALWSAASHQKTKLGDLILQHYEAAIASDHEKILDTARELQRKLNSNNDVLPLILKELNLPDYSSSSYTGISNDTAGYESEDNNIPSQDSLRERIKKWRKQADRGPGARKFSNDVREAYNYRCLFSGERFPRLDHFDSAGVDGAHILPWSTHGLNSVQNGICLCKQCHWGFDNGLFRLNFHATSNSYVLTIPKNIEEVATKEYFDLAHFKKETGTIDKSRLPKNHNMWPSPKYIQELNSKLPIDQ